METEAVLVNHKARPLMFKLDEDSYVIESPRHSGTMLVLTKEQVNKASEVNLQIKPENEVLLNHFLVKQVRKSLKRTLKVKRDDLEYCIFDLRWGLEGYENISVSLGFEPEDLDAAIKELKEFALSFPDNKGWKECINYLKGHKFSDKFKTISVDLNYYVETHGVRVSCCDGFDVEYTEHLKTIFPFF